MAWVVLRTGSLDWIKRWAKWGGESTEYQENRDGNWVSSISGVAIDDEWCVGAHMLICIYAQSQSKYISVFYFILFLYYFHFTVRTPFQFFPNFSLFFLPFYSLQKPVILTRHCWFCFCLTARVPACCVESNCIIRNTHAHLGMLSGVEAGGRNRVYAGWDTHSHFPPQCSDSHWGVSISQILQVFNPYCAYFDPIVATWWMIDDELSVVGLAVMRLWVMAKVKGVWCWWN